VNPEKVVFPRFVVAGTGQCITGSAPEHARSEQLIFFQDAFSEMFVTSSTEKELGKQAC